MGLKIYAGGAQSCQKLCILQHFFNTKRESICWLTTQRRESEERELMLLPPIRSQVQPTRVVKVLGLLGLE